MNSRERIMIAAKGGKPDIVPAFPYIGNYGAAVAGVPIGKYIMDGKVMAEAQLKAWELLKLDELWRSRTIIIWRRDSAARR